MVQECVKGAIRWSLMAITTFNYDTLLAPAVVFGIGPLLRKIYKDDDLFFIDTLGFRGEALPSIASVSKTEMTTSDGAVGTHIIIEGGHIIVDEPGALRKGTKITVTNLFYNIHADIFIFGQL